MKKIYPVIDSAEALEKALERVRAAQKKICEVFAKSGGRYL